jgi:hypothetical protein
MKKIVILLLFAPILFSCTSSNNNVEKNQLLIEKYVTAVENFDFQKMDEMLDDSYLGIGPSVGDEIGKAATIENWKFNVENLYKDIKYNKSRFIGINITTGENQGEWVSNWAELTITYKTDDQATVYANTIYQIKNNKIIKSFTFYNEADILEQLGFVFVDANNL